MSTEELDNQENNKPARDEKGRLLPGNTANPAGRPKGQSMKEFWKFRFATMTDEEKEQWAIRNKVSMDLVWQMAEGRPSQDTDITSGHKPIPILGNVPIYNGNQEDKPAEEENTSGTGGDIS